jgi:hypothetical protein
VIDGGAFTVAGMTTKAWSGLVKGERVAGATSDIGSINFVNGQVVLKSLHWEVAYPSGGTGQPNGSFSIGQLLIGGNAVPGADASALLAAANKVLGTLGIELDAPTATLVQGVEFVSPLEIRVVPNDTRDKILLAAIVPAQSAEHPIADGLETGFSPSEPKQIVQVVCQSDTPITVADITIASIDGGGYFSAGLGGANATSGDAPLNEFDLRLPNLSALGTNQLVPGTQGTAGTPAIPGQPATLANTAAAPSVPGAATKGGGPGQAATKPASAVSRTANGPLLAIGLGGLALLALLVEGDRRVMQRTQTVFSQFEE